MERKKGTAKKKESSPQGEKVTISWFPGHMAQTRRIMRENLSSVDLILEILDARIPKSSRNPEIRDLVAEKKSLLILNKADLADPEVTERWLMYYHTPNSKAIAVDCKNGKGISSILQEAKLLLQEKLQKNIWP